MITSLPLLGRVSGRLSCTRQVFGDAQGACALVPQSNGGFGQTEPDLNAHLPRTADFMILEETSDHFKPQFPQT